jgi:hypothetical protein
MGEELAIRLARIALAEQSHATHVVVADDDDDDDAVDDTSS